MPFTLVTSSSGRSKSVSTVPGAPPRTSTAATAAGSARITVQPVGRSARVKCPTLMPGTLVMPDGGAGRCRPDATTTIAAATSVAATRLTE